MRARLLIPALALLALALPASAGAALEEPLTEAPTAVTATAATLHGTLNPKSSATAGYHFTWNQGEGCEGNETEAQPEQTGEGIAAEATLSELLPHQQYAFCLVATHQEGETFESLPGPAESFETEALAPSVDSESASSINPFGARLEALVNPENQPTTKCRIDFGTALVSENEFPCTEPETLEGFGDQSVATNVGGLSPATTYKFRVVVANATGTTAGPEEEFTTTATEAPLVDAESASQFTTHGARLEAQVNPNYQPTSYVFEYASDEAMTAATTVAPPEGTEPFPGVFEDREAAVTLSALSPGTTYYYRVAATNETGTTQGAVQSFTTVGAPLVPASGEAQGVTRSSALLQGAEVDPVGAETSYYYRYLDQASYVAGLAAEPAYPYAKGGTSVPVGKLAASYEYQPAPAELSELRPGTTYHYALVAENEAGRTVGPDATFTTAPASPPAASTGAATALTPTTATLTATLTPNGLDTSWRLELASTPGAWGTVALGVVPAGAEATTLTVGLALLAPGTTYRYRLLASNADGEADGGEASFATPGLPPAPGIAPTPGPVPFTPLAVLIAQEPSETHSTSPHHLTAKQKLAKALKACRRKHAGARKACEHAARKHARRR